MIESPTPDVLSEVDGPSRDVAVTVDVTQLPLQLGETRLQFVHLAQVQLIQRALGLVNLARIVEQWVGVEVGLANS